MKRIGWTCNTGLSLIAWTALALAPVPAQVRAEGVLTNLSFSAFEKMVEKGGLVQMSVDGILAFDHTLVINRNTTIDAEGRTLAFNGLQLLRLFSVSGGATLVLNNLTLQDALADVGAAVKVTRGTLLATNCDFLRNVAKGTNGPSGKTGQNSVGVGGDGGTGGDGYAGIGGAIYSEGEVRLVGCYFQLNKANGGNGGAGGGGGNGAFRGGMGGNAGMGGHGLGGAIYSSAATWMSNCLFVANSATAGNGGSGGTNGSGGLSYPGRPGQGGDAKGGGIFSSGTLHVWNSTFNQNTTAGGNAGSGGGTINGGAMGADGRPGGDGLGGAIAGEGITQLIQCTINGNSAAGGVAGDGGEGAYGGGDGGNGGSGLGGGFYALGTAGITNCTFATNATAGGSAGNPGAGMVGGGYGLNGHGRGANLAVGSGSVILKNTILAYPGEGKNVHGKIVDAGANLSSDDSVHFVASNSRSRVDPLLDSLADNGGLVQTMALLPGSPAINTAHTLAWLAADQRGVLRPQGTGYDIGAYELELFSARGRVSLNNEGLLGIRVSLSGEAQRTTITDAEGNFGFFNLLSGVYSLVPGTAGMGFDPVSREVTLNSDTPEAVNQDFGRTMSISGRLLFRTNGIAGVRINLITGDTTNSILTDAEGCYAFTNIDEGTYILAPLANVSSYSPQSRTIVALAGKADAKDQTFVANTAPNQVIRGQVMLGASGLPGVLVTLAGELEHRAITDSNGRYEFTSLLPGLYRVYPTNQGATFLPPSIEVSLPAQSAQASNQVFTQVFSIFGRVTHDSKGLPGILVALSGSAHTNSTTTDPNGYYAFSGLPGAICRIVPGIPGMGFEPALRDYDFISEPQHVSGQDFARILAVRGRVLIQTNNGLAGVRIDILGSGITNTTLSSANGSYVFTNISEGTYTVKPHTNVIGYSPRSRTNTILAGQSDANDQDFTANADRTLEIHGRVLLGTNGLLGVPIDLAGAMEKHTVTVTNGSFEFSNLLPGVYTIQPPQIGAGFTPSSNVVDLVQQNSGATIEPFTANLPRVELKSYSIAQRVIGGLGLGIPNLTYTWEGSSNLATWVSLTNQTSPQGELLWNDTTQAPTQWFYRLSLPSYP